MRTARWVVGLGLVFAATAIHGAPFTPGNIVVYRTGDGASGLVNTGSAVFLDEFTPAGALVQSLPLPTVAASGQFPLIASGTATSEGLLTRSADRRFLIATGYGRPLGGAGSLAGTTGEAVPRVIARVDVAGLVDSSTALSDFASGNNPRSAVSSNGSDFWAAGGAGAVRYATLGSGTSTQLNTTPTNLRQLAIADGQLLVSTGSGSAFRVATVGAGLPTSDGQTLSNLPGFPVSGSPYAFVFVDLDGSVGLDTLYVADDSLGLQKYALVAGSWVGNGTLGGAGDLYRGLTGVQSGTTVTLYATRLGGGAAIGGGQLVSVVDSSGYNANLVSTPTVLATAASNTAFRGVAMAPEADLPPLGPIMRITEYMYAGADGEFIEFTNVGDAVADLSGWSFDDDSRVPGAFPLGAFGSVQPGESVILTESTAGGFRSAWKLCAGVKVIGGLDQNLGRNDEINLYDSDDQLVDRLSYGDQNFPGSIRTQNRSGYVSAAGLGANNALEWTLSALADGEDSVASVGNDLGSPGRSTRALFAFDPCAAQANAPTVSIDPVATSTLLDLAINVGGAASGVIDDPTDPAATVGIGLVFADPDGDPALLDISVESSNTAVVAPTGLLLGGSGDRRQLRILPSAVGFTQITVRATDADQLQGSYVIDFAASAASLNPAETRWHTGSSDASTAVAVDAERMLVADDENQVLRLYRRDLSGLHMAGFDFTSELALTDINGGVPREVDIEASTRSGNRIFWSGSHGNQASGAHNPRPNRRRVYATDLDVRGVLPTLSFAGRYDFLAEDLIAWDQADGHGLGTNFLGLAASAAAGVSPESPQGFNLEGLAMAPDGVGAYLAFRAPLLPTNARSEALLVPVRDFDALVTGAAPGSRPPGSAQFDPPILLDLGGRGIRSIEANAAGDYLIVAGPVQGGGAATLDFRLYRWSGAAEDAPEWLPAALRDRAVDGSFEGIVALPASLDAGASLTLLVDNGDAVYYDNGVAAKDLAERRHAKFRSKSLTLPPDTLFADGLELP